jgi:hypothetical protein
LRKKALAPSPRYTDVHVQLASERLRVRWPGDASAVPRLAKQLRALGFEAAPARSEAAHALRREQGRRSLARLGLAAVVTMQIMMLSVADYLDLLSDLTPAYRQLLLWAQGVLASLVMVGAAGPFFQGAWRSLEATPSHHGRARRPGPRPRLRREPLSCGCRARRPRGRRFTLTPWPCLPCFSWPDASPRSAAPPSFAQSDPTLETSSPSA